MESIIFSLGYHAKSASLVSGLTCISAFLIFFLLSLFARRTSPIRKQALYNTCSIYLLLVGTYEIFLYMIMGVTSDAQRALLYHRLAYFAGLPTIPLFLYIVIILSFGGFQELLLSSKLSPKWKNMTKQLWTPIWLLTAVVWLANFTDMITDSELLLAARAHPIAKSFIPLMGVISQANNIWGSNLFWRLWQATFTMIVIMSIAYLFRANFGDRIESSNSETKSFSQKLRAFFVQGVRNKNPNVKWLKTFSFLSLIHILTTAFQGLIGYDWPSSFPIPVYSASLLMFAFAFILIGEIVEARENVIVAYTSSYGSRMVSIVAHEMGTPLFIIRGFVTKLERDFQKRLKKNGANTTHHEIERHLAYLDKIQKALDRLAETADDLKTKAGIFRTTLKPAPINDIISQIAVPTNYDSKGKKFSFKLSLDSGIDRIIIDEEQMRLILRNLIENSIDSVPQNGGIIQVATRVRKNQVAICVQDNGAGIPKKYLDKIREPFFTTKLKGTGLGLSIIEGFLKEIKGTLNIESAEGIGTTVEIALPKSVSPMIWKKYNNFTRRKNE